jgi:hypothetical protein
MISFKQFIKESKGEFKYVKLPRFKTDNITMDIELKGKTRTIVGIITFRPIYRVPLFPIGQDKVDETREHEIKLYDIDVEEISNIHETINHGGIIGNYAPFRDRLSEMDASYIKSVFIGQWVNAMIEGSTAGIDLQRVINMANDILSNKTDMPWPPGAVFTLKSKK